MRRYDDIVEVKKYNHNHDELGRFASKGGGGGASSHSTKAERIASTVGYRSITGNMSSQEVDEAINRGGYLGELNGKNYLISPQKDRTITVYTGKNTKSGGFEMEKYITGLKIMNDARAWGRGTILNEK